MGGDKKQWTNSLKSVPFRSAARLTISQGCFFLCCIEDNKSVIQCSRNNVQSHLSKGLRVLFLFHKSISTCEYRGFNSWSRERLKSLWQNDRSRGSLLWWSTHHWLHCPSTPHPICLRGGRWTQRNLRSTISSIRSTCLQWWGKWLALRCYWSLTSERHWAGHPCQRCCIRTLLWCRQQLLWRIRPTSSWGGCMCRWATRPCRWHSETLRRRS